MQRHTCRICNKEKNITEFYRNNTHRKNPTIDACKKCKQAQLQKRYSKSDEAWLGRRLTHSRRANRHGKIPALPSWPEHATSRLQVHNRQENPGPDQKTGRAIHARANS